MRIRFECAEARRSKPLQVWRIGGQDRIAPAADKLVVHVEKNSDYREPKVATKGPKAKVDQTDHGSTEEKSGENAAPADHEGGH